MTQFETQAGLVPPVERCRAKAVPGQADGFVEWVRVTGLRVQKPLHETEFDHRCVALSGGRRVGRTRVPQSCLGFGEV